MFDNFPEILDIGTDSQQMVFPQSPKHPGSRLMAVSAPCHQF
jgi:hypothetical protein